MSTQWLTVRSFQQSQELLEAINALSIQIKLKLAGIKDQDRENQAKEAQESLKAFLGDLDVFVGAGPVTGADARTRQGPIENSRTIRDETSSRHIAVALLKMHHEWAANDYKSKGMTVPKTLVEQGEVSARSAGELGAYVQYDL